MIKVENIDVWGFEAAIRGMRNPMNSWQKSDSEWKIYMPEYPNLSEADYIVGKNDLDLMRRLYNAGTEHRTYARMIQVSMDITAPLYWWGGMDRYTVGKSQVSCSFMHKGVSKPFDIRDFSIHDERVYDILSPLDAKEYIFHYPYETAEYKIYTTESGREIEVYRNGKIVEREFTITDSKKRTKTFPKHEYVPQNKATTGYFGIRCGGERWCIHKLVASVWIDNPNGYETVNHIDGNKANNSVENLEWCSLSENISKGFNDGLYTRGKSLHAKYQKWKNGHTGSVIESECMYSQIRADHKKGLTCKDLADKYNISVHKANNIISFEPYENADLFMLCYAWEHTLDALNNLRAIYLETGDNQIFQQIRCLLPCGWNLRRTVCMSYETVFKIIKERTGHKLDEWVDFVEILKDLPYVKEIME